MNREIKFRAKSVETGEWLIGYYVQLAGFDYIVPFNSSFRHILDADFEDAFEEVDVKTLQQWTGFKDKNGAEIYQGSILGRKSQPETRFVVIWSKVGQCFATRCEELDERVNDDGETVIYWRVKYNHPLPGILTPHYGYEVIGNIDDNPELLK